MKTNFLNSKLFKIIAGICYLSACQSPLQEDVSYNNEDDKKVQIVDGTLKFSKVSDYELFFEQRALFEIPEFNSLSKHASSWSANERIKSVEGSILFEELQDAVIMDLLDKDGMIIIEDHLIFLDFENLVAAVTKNHSLREEILTKNYDDEDVFVFSFNDDVLEIISGDDKIKEIKSQETIENLRIQSGCPGSYPPGSTFPPMVGDNCGDRTCGWTSLYSEAGWQYRADAKHVYQAAAIYFRLKSEIAHFKRNTQGSNIWTSEGNAQMKITYWGSFTPRNRSTIQLSGCFDQCQGCSPQPSNQDKVQKIHHEAGRRLTQYNLYGIYDVHLGGAHAFSGYPDVFQLYNIQRN